MGFGQFEEMILIVNNCVKNVPIRVFSGPYFPAFRLNMEILRILGKFAGGCGCFLERGVFF